MARTKSAAFVALFIVLAPHRALGVNYGATKRVKVGDSVEVLSKLLGAPLSKSRNGCDPIHGGGECWVFDIDYHPTWEYFAVTVRSDRVQAVAWTNPNAGGTPGHPPQSQIARPRVGQEDIAHWAAQVKAKFDEVMTGERVRFALLAKGYKTVVDDKVMPELRAAEQELCDTIRSMRQALNGEQEREVVRTARREVAYESGDANADAFVRMLRKDYLARKGSRCSGR